MRNLLPNLLLPAAACVLLPGCSLFQKTESIQAEPVLPQDREHIVQADSTADYTSNEAREGMLRGDWAIETVMGKDAVGEKTPFIKFVPSAGRIYGNNGCNVINGSYKASPADSTISFSNIAATMMLCHQEGLTDYEINTALASAHYYSWTVVNSDMNLTLYNELRQPVMTLLHQNFEFLNGTWNVTKIGDTDVMVQGMRMVIDIAEGKVHGNTGCNILNGNVEIDMEKPNSISFSAISTTRAACPEGNMETAFIVALEEVAGARPVSANEVILYDDRRQPVLTLERE